MGVVNKVKNLWGPIGGYLTRYKVRGGIEGGLYLYRGIFITRSHKVEKLTKYKTTALDLDMFSLYDIL